MERIIGSERIGPADEVGGKARNLAELARAGLPVPPWFAVTTAVLADVKARAAGAIDASLAGLDPHDRKAALAASERVRAALREAGLGLADRVALLARFDATFPGGAFVAVRSSAVGEDSARDSFAGQMDSFLHVTRATVEERLLDCIASAWSPRAILYRRLRNHDPARVEAAAVIQLMVEARVSGILFTANPTSGDRAEAVLSAGLGLGEGVVQDLVETDTFFADLASGAVRDRALSEKRSCVVFDREKGGGTRLAEVPADERSKPALTDREIHDLVALGRRVAAHMGGAPQDIEWAIDGAGAIHLLQARPVTTLDRERESVFDNSNIVESYPGLSAPLTFSFARQAYEQCFREGSRTFGVPERVLAENWHVHANLLALIDGRIYYGILNWYKLFQLVPGFEGVLPAWEKALGLRRRFVRPPPPPPLLRRAGQVPVKLRVVRRVIGHFVRLSRNVRRFEVEFQAVQAEFRARDLEAVGAHELLELYERLSRRVLPGYSISLVNDFFSQQLVEALGKLVTRYGLGDATAVRNDLLAGESGMESVEPVRSMLALTDMIRADPALRAVVEDAPRPAADVLRALRADSRFAAALDRHFELYGDRTLHELKLETPLAEENPGFLVAMFRNYLAGGQDAAAIDRRERARREHAAAAVRERLAGRPLRRRIFDFVLRHTRKTVRYRENLRLLRSRAYGMVKRIFRALGRQFAAKGLLDDPGDLFYLTVEEVAAHVRGLAVTRDLRALAALRKREYEAFRARSPDPRITTRGVVYASPFESPPPAAAAAAAEADGGEVLRGVPCSPGRVAARAKVILAPDQELTVRGEILVAPMTDPGWVFLMVAAGGIVSEKGSLLSHTAIIGRELGVPTVVGVRGATSRIADGRPIEIDGAAGTVHLPPAGR